MNKKVRKAVIPAAGFGTRFLPATKAMPKEMLPIVDKPAIQYIIEEAVASGIEEILIITNGTKKIIEDHFDYSFELEMILEKKGKIELLKEVKNVSKMVDIHYIRQKEQNGLGHAISYAKTFVGNEPFAVLLGDDVVYNPENPCLKQMIDCYDKYRKSIIGVQLLEWDEVSKFGIVDFGNDDYKSWDSLQSHKKAYKVHDLVEKPDKDIAPSNVAILGRYIIVPEIFDILAETEAGVGGEIQLTDALKVLAKEDEIYAYNFEGIRYDVGNKLGFLKATVEETLRREDLKDNFLDYLRGIIK